VIGIRLTPGRLDEQRYSKQLFASRPTDGVLCPFLLNRGDWLASVGQAVQACLGPGRAESNRDRCGTASRLTRPMFLIRAILPVP
jgi:hypothetical protein